MSTFGLRSVLCVCVVFLCGCAPNDPTLLLEAKLKLLSEAEQFSSQRFEIDECTKCVNSWHQNELDVRVWKVLDSLSPDGKPEIVLERGSGPSPYAPRYVLNTLIRAINGFELVLVSCDVGPEVSIHQLSLSEPEGREMIQAVKDSVEDLGRRIVFGEDVVNHCGCVFLHVFQNDAQVLWLCSAVRDTALVNYLDRVLDPQIERSLQGPK